MNNSKGFLKGDYQRIQARKLTKDTVSKFGYFTSKYKGAACQVAPYYNKDRELVGQHLRFKDKQFAWVGSPKEALLFGQHLWPSKGRRVVITEGEIDCMTISQALGNKWPVVSISSGVQSAVKNLKAQLSWLEGYREVVLAFDDDEPGRKAVSECALLFTPGKVKVLSYNGKKDANELAQVGEVAVLVTNLFNAEEYRPDGLIPGDSLWQLLSEDPKAGLPTPFPLLNLKTYGFRPGELYMFTGGSGIGKSTIVHEIGYHFLTKHKQKIGVVALEESKQKTAQRYIGIYLNKPISISRDNVTKEEIRKAYDETINNKDFWLYDHWGSTEIDSLLSKLRYMAVGLGCQWIILDHISIIVSGLDVGNDERRTIDIFMTKLRSLIEHTGVGIIAVVHLKRPGVGKSFTEGRPVSLSDLRGSASLEQISDVVIASERNQQGDEPDRVTVRILKNRPVGQVGVVDTLKYSHKTGRLLPEEKEETIFNPEKEEDF